MFVIGFSIGQEVLERESGPVLALNLRGSLDRSHNENCKNSVWNSGLVLNFSRIDSCVSDGGKMGTIPRTWTFSPMLTLGWVLRQLGAQNNEDVDPT